MWYEGHKDVYRKQATAWAKANPAKRAWILKKARAKRGGLAFNLDVAFFENVPTECPVLFIPLHKNGPVHSDNYPEVDRIVPAKGYVLGNCRWISARANRLKQDSTIYEIGMLWEDALRNAA